MIARDSTATCFDHHPMLMRKPMPNFSRFVLMTLALLGCTLTLPGCNSYVLQGRVVRGVASEVQLVYASDERLKAQGGVDNVEVRISRDPTTLNRHLVGHSRSGGGGDFTIIMGEFGTGWMQEQWLVQAVAAGFGNAEQLTQLPSKNSKWRLLITLAPGTSEPVHEEDLRKEAERFKGGE